LLVLSRKPEQSLVLGDSITITVLAVDGDRVKLGIEAPRTVTVLREEIYRQIQLANAAAAASPARGLTPRAASAALRERVALVVTTFGEQGAELDARGEVLRVPAAPARQVVDPTGAGDAFRAGLMLGLTRGYSLEMTGRIAAQAATYAIEHLGTQEHFYTTAEFAERFNRTFPDAEQLTPELGSQVRRFAGSQARGLASGAQPFRSNL
jgi:carbon storage regulator CsrA